MRFTVRFCVYDDCVLSPAKSAKKNYCKFTFTVRVTHTAVMMARQLDALTAYGVMQVPPSRCVRNNVRFFTAATPIAGRVIQINILTNVFQLSHFIKRPVKLCSSYRLLKRGIIFWIQALVNVVMLENVYKTTVNILRVGLRWLKFYVISISSMTPACFKSCVIGTGVVVAQICSLACPGRCVST